MNKIDYRWWQKSGDDTAKAAVALAKQLEQQSTLQHEFNLRHMRLYGSFEYHTLLPYENYSLSKEAAVTYNLIKSGVDAMVARIARQRPVPVFSVRAGNFSLTRKARMQERFSTSQIEATGFRRKAPQIARDAGVFGTGVCHVYREGEKLCVERVYPGEILVDAAEGMYGEPRQLLRRKYIHKENLKALFPDKEVEIDRAKPPRISNTSLIPRGNNARLEDLVEVVMAWHLPSGPDAEDGKYLVAVDGCTLHESEYEYDEFPFFFLQWSQQPLGFWGTGIAYELTGSQVEINRLLWAQQRALMIHGKPLVFVQQTKGNMANPNLMSNRGMEIIPYGTGDRPTVVVPNVITPESMQQIDRIIQRAYEQIGISQLDVQAMPPSGLQSGVGIREASDVSQSRLTPFSQEYEAMHLWLAKWFIRLGKEIHRENPKWSVVASRDRWTVERVPWKEIDMDMDDFSIEIQPSSELPFLPSGRKDFIIDMINAGMINPVEGKRMLQMADVDREMASDRAFEEGIDRIIEGILDDGVYEAPEPFFDHRLALKKGQAWYVQAQNMGAPPDRLELLAQWIDAVMAFIAKAEQEQQARANAAQAGLQTQPQPGAPPAPGPNGAPPNAATSMAGLLG